MDNAPFGTFRSGISMSQCNIDNRRKPAKRSLSIELRGYTAVPAFKAFLNRLLPRYPQIGLAK